MCIISFVLSRNGSDHPVGVVPDVVAMPGVVVENGDYEIRAWSLDF